MYRCDELKAVTDLSLGYLEKYFNPTLQPQVTHFSCLIVHLWTEENFD